MTGPAGLIALPTRDLIHAPRGASSETGGRSAESPSREDFAQSLREARQTPDSKAQLLKESGGNALAQRETESETDASAEAGFPVSERNPVSELDPASELNQAPRGSARPGWEGSAAGLEQVSADVTRTDLTGAEGQVATEIESQARKAEPSTPGVPSLGPEPGTGAPTSTQQLDPAGEPGRPVIDPLRAAASTAPAGAARAQEVPATSADVRAFDASQRVQLGAPAGVSAADSSMAASSTADAASAVSPPAASSTPPLTSAPPAPWNVHSLGAAAAASIRTSPVPSPPALHAQLVGPVAQLASGPDGERLLTVNIAPEHLGPVTVRADLSGDRMRIELFATGDTGRDALRGMLGDLRRDLAGLGLGSGQVSLGEGEPPSSATGQGRGDGPPSDRSRDPAAEQTLRDETTGSEKGADHPQDDPAADLSPRSDPELSADPQRGSPLALHELRSVGLDLMA